MNWFTRFKKRKEKVKYHADIADIQEIKIVRYVLFKRGKFVDNVHSYDYGIPLLSGIIQVPNLPRNYFTT